MTCAELKKYVYYEPKTGIFTWIKKTGPRSKIGEEVGGIDISDGYMKAQINGESVKLHRMAYLYMTGSEADFIDHDNRIRNDNRWLNLKSTTQHENNKNRNKQLNNKSGITGVALYKPTGKYRAFIYVMKKQISLGHFTDINDAVDARKTAEIKYGFHSNHGK